MRTSLQNILFAGLIYIAGNSESSKAFFFHLHKDCNQILKYFLNATNHVARVFCV